MVSDPLWPHGLQHTRLPCPSLSPEFAQMHVHWVDDAIQPSHPLSPFSPPALNLSQHQDLFQWVGSSHQVAKVLELQHQSFQWIFNNQWILISFRIDWFVLLAVQGTLKSSPGPQFKVILQCSAIFIIQISHSHMAMEKNIALNIWTFVGKVMSLLLNMLSRLQADSSWAEP